MAISGPFFNYFESKNILQEKNVFGVTRVFNFSATVVRNISGTVFRIRKGAPEVQQIFLNFSRCLLEG
jgi:hypothetical protein